MKKGNYKLWILIVVGFLTIFISTVVTSKPLDNCHDLASNKDMVVEKMTELSLSCMDAGDAGYPRCLNLRRNPCTGLRGDVWVQYKNGLGDKSRIVYGAGDIEGIFRFTR